MHIKITLNIRMIALFIAFAMVGFGCNSHKNAETRDTTILQSTLARDTNPQASDADLLAVAQGNTDFALKIFSLLDPASNSNLVFSPYSITMAFALTAAGAGGTTLSGIERAMSYPLPQASLNPAFNKLDLLLAANTNGSVHADGSRSPRLTIVNAVWGQQGFTILPSYLDTLALNFGAGLHVVDFMNTPEQARTTINSWVENQTNGRITDLIPEGGVTTDNRIILTNAIWFKAEWASQFQTAATMDQAFTGSDNSSSTVPFMHQTLSLPYANSNGCQSVDIPYVDRNLSMLILMPAPGTIDTFLTAPTPTTLDAIINLLDNPQNKQEIELAMPKFTFSSAPNVTQSLKDFGMTDAFDPLNADFSGIDGRRDLFIDGVYHKAFISVDENGTEAAAATGIGMSGTSMPVSPVMLTIDHPFIFMIRDRQTGLVLFLGKVVSL